MKAKRAERWALELRGTGPAGGGKWGTEVCPDGQPVRLSTDTAEWEWALSEEAGRLSLKGTVLSGRQEACEVAMCRRIPDWDERGYLLAPAAAYRGNRFPVAERHTISTMQGGRRGELLVSSQIPKLRWSEEEPDYPLEIPVNHCATPMLALYRPRCREALILSLAPGTANGFRIRECLEAARLEVEICTPLVRERIISPNAQGCPSADLAMTCKAGESVSLDIGLEHFRCKDLGAFFGLAHQRIMKALRDCPLPHPPLTLSQCWDLQEEKFNGDNWDEVKGVYNIFINAKGVASCETGWTGGMQVQFPLYALGNARTRERALRNLDFLFTRCQAANGLFYSIFNGKASGEAYNNEHLLRRSGDALLFALRQMRLVKADPRKARWEAGARRCAERLARIASEFDPLPQYVDQETAQPTVYGSTSAAIVIAALAEAYDYFEEKAFLEAARIGATHLAEEYLQLGLFGGGPNDASQSPDSESLYAVLEGLVSLYEASGEDRWLEEAQSALHLLTTWVTSYDFRFPKGTTMDRLGMSTAGSVWANVRNKHAAPGFCTYSGSALWRLYRHTGDASSMTLLQYIVRVMPQYLSRADRPIPTFPENRPLPPGWMNEVIYFNDQNRPYANPYASPPGELWYGSCWCEISLMLATAELPGIHIDLPRRRLWCLDGVEACFDEDENAIVVRNPTPRRCRVSYFIEQEERLPASVDHCTGTAFEYLELEAGESRKIPTCHPVAT